MKRKRSDREGRTIPSKLAREQIGREVHLREHKSARHPKSMAKVGNKLTAIHSVLSKTNSLPSLIPDEPGVVASDLHFLGWHMQGEKLEVCGRSNLGQGVRGSELRENMTGSHVDDLRGHVDKKLDI